MDFTLLVSIITLIAILILICWFGFRVWFDNYGKNKRLLNDRIERFLRDKAQESPEFIFSPGDIFSKNSQIDQILHQIPLSGLIFARLSQAGWNWRVDKLVVISCLLTISSALVLIFYKASTILTIVLAGAVGSIPFIILSYQAKKRQDKIEEQLPGVLDYISRAMKSGGTFTNAMQLAAKEAPNPIGEEFSRVANQIAYGRNLGDALADLNAKIQCNELGYFSVAVVINREVGGNLAILLERVSGLIRERLRFRSTVKAMTGEVRISAWILGSLPFIMGLLMFVLNKELISVLWIDPMGIRLSAYAAVMLLVGVIWLKKIATIRY